MDDDEKEARKAQLREVAARLERGEIKPIEALQEVLGVVGDLGHVWAWGKDNVHDVTLPMKAVLYAINRVDIADSIAVVQLTMAPGKGVGCRFSVKKDGSWWPKDDDLNKLMSPDQLTESTDGTALSTAIFMVMRAMGVPMKTDEDGNLTFDEMAGLMSIPLGEVEDEAISEFRKAMDVALGEDYKKPQGPTMEKWG